MAPVKLAAEQAITMPRCIYTDRALSQSQTLATKLFNQPLYILQQLSNTVGLARLIIVITISCLLGITMGLGALRSYQATATLPTTSFAAPGKVSYCSYASFIAIINFAWWLLAVCLALLIAANLVWLTIAFLFESALYMGVMSMPENAESSAASYAAARQVVGGLAMYSSTIAPVVAKDATIGTMPEDLVHVLAALALMGLGCLWQLMNLSANFAHARRDIQDLQKSNPVFMTGDAVASVQATLTVLSSKKSPAKVTAEEDQDTQQHTSLDTSAIFPSISASSAAAEGMTADEEPAFEVPAAAFSVYTETYDDKPIMPALDSHAMTPASVRPTPRQSEATDVGSVRGTTFNTTAQRYAAYRLRAAQAAAAKGSGTERKQWIR
eukprot:gene8719-8900_t